jgi:hypothetical protein
MKKVIQVLLIALIIVLAYLIVKSIMRPIEFQREVTVRENAAIDKLKDIREAQKAYKDVYKRYTGSFDTLEMFLKTDSFTVIKAVGMVPEDWIDEVGLAEARERAVREGIIIRETSLVSVLDSLFGKNFAVDSMKYVPYTDGVIFDIESNEIMTTSNLMVQVVEVSCLYDDLLQGMDPQLVINYKDERIRLTGFPGIKFGSLEEGTLTGNWE